MISDEKKEMRGRRVKQKSRGLEYVLNSLETQDASDSLVAHDLPNAHESEVTQCWICFEECSTLRRDRAIQPCNCKGSVGTVHEHCLREWIITSQHLHCTRCTVPYTLIYDSSDRWWEPLIRSTSWFELVLACSSIMVLALLYACLLYIGRNYVLNLLKLLDFLAILIFIGLRQSHRREGDDSDNVNYEGRPDMLRLLGNSVDQTVQEITIGPPFSLCLLRFVFSVSRLFCAKAKRRLRLSSFRILPHKPKKTSYTYL
jgi:hypothetical protein